MVGVAASPAIGIATANGSFKVNGAVVTGNTTLFEGAVIETSSVPSVLDMDGATRVTLSAGSRGTVYRGRLVLERGQGQAENARIQARGLLVTPQTDGKTLVSLRDERAVLVEALAGPVSVSTAEGMLVAGLEVGHALSFVPQAAGAAAPFQISGCMARFGDVVLLRDEAAGVTFELRGKGLDKYAGRRVQVTGTQATGVKPSAGASDVIRVAGVKASSGGPCAVLASPKKAPSGSAAGKATAAGLGKATKAIVAGVLVGGAGAGAAVALSEEEKPTISR
jgi:hypothetical protein